MELLVRRDGMVRCVYGEEIDLRELGPLNIRRASHVEPTADGQWIADLVPVRGPLLGPYPCRSDALEAEIRWLNDKWLPDTA